MKTKTMTIQVKAGPADGLAVGQFSAYASVFGNRDSYGDVVVAGAFKDTLAEWAASGNPIPLLFGHNMSDPDYNIGEVASAKEDDHGLLVTGQLDMESPKAAQVYRLLKGRRINQMSFAYDVVDGGVVNEVVDEVETHSYELRKLKLYEVSVVPLGANQETEVLAVKTAVAALTGEKAGRVLAAKHINSLRKAQEAIGVVIAAAEVDQDKASGTGDVKDEEPIVVKSEEPNPNPSARALAELQLLALI